MNAFKIDGAGLTRSVTARNGRCDIWRATNDSTRAHLALMAVGKPNDLHLAPALADFLAAYPELDVDVIMSDRFVDLVEDGFDVAVRIWG